MQAQAIRHVDGTAFVPDVAAPDAQRVTRVPPCPPFFFRAHPERWTILGGEIVPNFAMVQLMAGLNNTEQVLRRGQPERVRIGGARESAVARGWTIIPIASVPPHHVKPGQVRSYLYCPDGRPDVHLSIYTKVYPGSDQIGTDQKGFIEFCRYQVEQGVIPPPPLYVLEKMLANAEERIAKATDRSQRSTQAAGAVRAIEQEIEVLRAAIGKTRAEIEPSGGRAVDLDDDGEAEFRAPEPEPEPRQRRRRSTPAAFVQEATP